MSKIAVTNQQFFYYPEFIGNTGLGIEKTTTITIIPNPDNEIDKYACCKITLNDFTNWQVKNSRNVQGGSKLTRTAARVQLGGRNAVVYQGPRGGKYVKVGGEYVPVAKAVNAKATGEKQNNIENLTKLPLAFQSYPQITPPKTSACHKDKLPILNNNIILFKAVPEKNLKNILEKGLMIHLEKNNNIGLRLEEGKQYVTPNPLIVNQFKHIIENSKKSAKFIMIELPEKSSYTCFKDDNHQELSLTEYFFTQNIPPEFIKEVDIKITKNEILWDYDGPNILLLTDSNATTIKITGKLNVYKTMTKDFESTITLKI